MSDPFNEYLSDKDRIRNLENQNSGCGPEFLFLILAALLIFLTMWVSDIGEQTHIPPPLPAWMLRHNPAYQKPSEKVTIQPTVEPRVWTREPEAHFTF